MQAAVDCNDLPGCFAQAASQKQVKCLGLLAFINGVTFIVLCIDHRVGPLSSVCLLRSPAGQKLKRFEPQLRQLGQIKIERPILESIGS